MNLKLFLLIFAFSSSTTAQSTLSCYYEDIVEMWYVVDYYCVLNIDNEDGSDNFNWIGGSHPGNLTDSDVTSVYGMAARENSVKIVPSKVCSQFSQLKKLWLDDLTIRTVTESSFADCRQLEDLYLGYNHISSLPGNAFRQNSNLKILDLGHNQLKGFAAGLFSALGKLEKLHLDFNNLVGLEGFYFEGLTELKVLNLDGNQITNFGKGAFEKLAKLEVLQVNSNHLRVINSNAFHQPLENLVEIQAAFNEISAVDLKIFTQLPNLKIASFDKNLCVDKTFEDFKSENINEFKECGYNFDSSALTCQNWNLGFTEGRIYTCLLDIFNPYLRDDFDVILGEHVNRTKADIRLVFGESSRSDSVRIVPSIICEEFENLQDLYLDGLGVEILTQKSFASCQNIESLYLSHNLLFAIPQKAFEANSKLKFLDLGSNKLETLEWETFANLVNLESLYIDHNPVQFISSDFFHTLTSLKTLWMSSIHLEVIKSEWFEPLEELEELRLDNTDIFTLSSSNFAKNSKLKVMHLSFNRIITLTSDLLPSTLTELHFAHNHINYVQPNFFNSLNNLEIVVFEGNFCVDEKFEAFGLSRSVNIEKFQRCFENYNDNFQSDGAERNAATFGCVLLAIFVNMLKS